MARQRRLSRAAPNLSAIAPSDARTHDFELAIKRAINRLVTRPAPMGVSLECAATQRGRELSEVIEMLARVRHDAPSNGYGWDWNLLHVLDWSGGNIEVNERRFRPAIIESTGPKTGARVLAARREHDLLRAARGKRLYALRAAFDAAQPDLEWAMRRSGELAQGFAAADTGMADLIDRAIEDHESAESGIRAFGRIHGKVRRVEHVKVAAMLVLSECHGLAGAQEKAAIVSFIEATNERLSPKPCPDFATEPTHDKVHKMLSRCGF